MINTLIPNHGWFCHRRNSNSRSSNDRLIKYLASNKTWYKFIPELFFACLQLVSDFDARFKLLQCLILGIFWISYKKNSNSLSDCCFTANQKNSDQSILETNRQDGKLSVRFWHISDGRKKLIISQIIFCLLNMMSQNIIEKNQESEFNMVVKLWWFIYHVFRQSIFERSTISRSALYWSCRKRLGWGQTI